MPITYVDVPISRRDRVTAVRLLSHLRLHTLIADVLTGVAERRESYTYNASIIREWLGASPSYANPPIKELYEDWREVVLKVATHPFYGARNPQKKEERLKQTRFLIKGSPDEVVTKIESLRGWPSDNSHFGIQYLRYRDARVKITVDESFTNDD